MGKLSRSESGQAVTENMLIISVIVISIVGGAQSFIGTVRSGVQELGNDVSDILTSGSIGGVGFSGSGGSNGGPSGGNGPSVNGGPSFNRGINRGNGASPASTQSTPGNNGRFGNGSFDTANNNGNSYGLPDGLGFPMPPRGDTA